jgi:hypothetical protein
MRPGTYRDLDGNLVVVRRTATGYTVTPVDGDGPVRVIGDEK